MATKGRTTNAQSGAGSSKNNHPFSQFAWRKSIVVSNAQMRAVNYGDSDALGDNIDGILGSSLPLLSSFEASPTGRKDAKSQDEKESNVTISAGYYPYLPVGKDSVVIVFDIKVVNATSFPQSAKIETWNAVTTKKVSVEGQLMTVHQALTCRAREVFGLVAEQVFSCRWAWRNRDEATRCRLIVKDEAGQSVTNADDLAQAMYTAFSQNKPALWRVAGIFKLGTGSSMRVYPSQLFKADDKDAKVAEYYKIPGTEDFGMRAVKIGNRLKTIDRWYHAYDVIKMSIPVEPMGYFHALRTCLRKDDIAVNLMTQAITGNGQWSENEALYMNALTLFGGLLTAEDNKTGSDKRSGPQDGGSVDVSEEAAVQHSLDV